MNEPWRIRVLGGLQAECEEYTITRFRTRKTGWLLAYLAYYLKRIHPREELAARFWPDADPDVGRTNLRTALSSLRRQLEPSGTHAGAVLIADRVNVRLNPEAVTVDAAQFEAALKSAEVLSEDFRRIGALTQAVEHYGGELLPGFDEEWVLTERERLGQAYLGALRQLTRLLEKTGDLSRALDYARRAVAADLFDEERHQDLMRLLAANGQPAAAVRQFEELRRLLREEMEETPSTATRALAERIQCQPKSLRASLPVAASPSAAPDPLCCPALPTGTVTFLLTDIESSTAQWERTGEAFVRALARHNALLREAFQEHGGHEVKALGDGFLVTFSRAEEALACAIAGQRALAAEVWPEPTGAVRVRMALHTGDVEPERSDYHSLVLHRAARIVAAAHGGQILCSEATAALLRRDLGAGVRLVDLGLHRLRDVPLPERLFMAQYPDTAPRQFPPLRTEPIHTPRLPLQFTRFFGREAEIAALGELLRAPETRLVTLTGPGGSGKTRLAIEVAGRLGDPFGGAIYFAPLAGLSEARQISDALLGALGLERLPSVEPLAQIARFLEGGRSLLLLDNLEHLVEEGAPLVHELLMRAPQLTCLTTSRQKLEIAAEREFVVLPLPVPKSAHGVSVTAERLMEVASVQLFTDRARAARPDFAVTPGNAGSVAALCARLEGIPLAIELAAARASMLTPAQMLSQLGASLDFLVSRRRDIEPRHRTLRAAILWSFETLSSELQRFFASLSVFRGGWTLEAAEIVCQEPGAPRRVLDRLTELRACSLVLAIQEGGNEGTRSPGCPEGVMRYRMLETLREFAEEQVLLDEETRLPQRHADWCVALAEEAIHHLRGPEQGPWLDRLQAEHDNFRAALAWLLETDSETALRLATMLYSFWDVRGHVREGSRWLERALARSADQSVLRARALDQVGALAWFETDYARARERLEESLALYRRLGHPDITGPLTHLSSLLMFEGNPRGARLLLEEAMAAMQASGDVSQKPGVLENLSRAALLERDYSAAERLAEECLALARQVGDRDSAMGSLINLGLSALNQGDRNRARRLFQELFAEAESLGDVSWHSGAAWALGLTALLEGDYRAARSLQAQSLALLGESGFNYVKIYILEVVAYAMLAEGRAPHDALRGARLLGAVEHMKQMGYVSITAQVHADMGPFIARARADLGEREFAEAYASGATLTVEQALAEAFAPDGPPEGGGQLPARSM